MKEIMLTQGYTTWVDNEDYKKLNKWKWHVQKDRSGNRYAQRTVRIGTMKFNIKMHREILGLGPEDPECDHIDGNGLHNWRNNLRIATHSQNQVNRITKNKNGFRGVQCRSDRKKPWSATIKINQKAIYLGSFSVSKDAARAYDRAAIEYFGEFATNVLNFPIESYQDV